MKKMLAALTLVFSAVAAEAFPVTLEQTEKDWLAGHGAIRIGTYDKDDFWVRVNKDGSYGGIMPEYVASLFSLAGISNPIEWNFFDGRESALQAMRAGKIDILTPYYCSPVYAEKDGVIISAQSLRCSFSVLYLGDYTRSTMSVIAAPGTRLGARYVRDNYPKAKLVACRNGFECVEKLLSGRATSVVMNSEGLRQIADRYEEDFKIRPLNAECPLAFVALPENAPLISVINRAIEKFPSVELNELFDKYGVESPTHDTAWQFLRRHPGYIHLGVTLVLLLAMIFTVIKMRADRRRRESDLTRRMLAFTNYFLDTFISSYSVDLRTHAYDPYMRDQRIAKDYPILPDYLESLSDYAEREVHPDDRKELLDFIQPDNLRGLLKKSPVVACSFRVITGGKEQMIGLRVVRGADEDSVAFAFADITDETRREQERQHQLEQALAQVAAANRSKTSFLFNMSHDIRTPMNAIIGFTDIARKNLDDRKRVEDCLEKVNQSGELLLELINSVLDMSRVESGKAKLEETPGDVRTAFSILESTMSALAQEKGVKLEFKYGKVDDPYVYADIERCHRVFVNIISNAIKYSKPGGGYVKVLCEQVGSEEVRVKSEELGKIARFRFTFTDNGIGMSQDFLEHIFEEFARERNSTTSGVQGTGLGMALCKSFVELMGGTIRCQSKQGEGTVITVELPFKVRGKSEEGRVEEVESSAGVSASLSALASKRVLLVEDNDLNREVAEYMLKEIGLAVDTAVNGKVAVEKVTGGKSGSYDAVLMDIQMPVMGGYDATKAIRGWEKSVPGSHLPIIALSANAFAEDRAASFAAGMDDHIAKPIKAKELVSVLSKFVR